MLTKEGIMEIAVLFRQGRSIRDIAREVGVSRNTVRRYVRDAQAATMKRPPRRAHKLDPYRRYLEERVRAAHPAWLPATMKATDIEEIERQIIVPDYEVETMGELPLQ
jgi:transposase